MCMEHCQNEHELLSQFHVQLHETLLQEIEASREQQLRHLDNVHERVVIELKKQLDQQSRDDMKQVCKRHKDKNDLARSVTLLAVRVKVKVILDTQRPRVPIHGFEPKLINCDFLFQNEKRDETETHCLSCARTPNGKDLQFSQHTNYL